MRPLARLARENPIAAREEAVGLLRLRGVVGDLQERAGVPVLDLSEAGYPMVRCAMEPSPGLAALRRGNSVTLLCRYQGTSGGDFMPWLLFNCHHDSTTSTRG